MSSKMLLEEQSIRLRSPEHDIYHPMLELVMTRHSVMKRGERVFISAERLKRFGFPVEEQVMDDKVKAYTPREFTALVRFMHGPHNVLNPEIVESEIFNIFDRVNPELRMAMRRPGFELIEVPDNAPPDPTDPGDPGSLLPPTGAKVKNWKDEDVIAYYDDNAEEPTLRIQDLVRCADSVNVGMRAPTYRGPQLNSQLFAVGTISGTTDHGGYHQVTHVLYVPTVPNNPKVPFRGYLIGLGAVDMLEKFYYLLRSSTEWSWQKTPKARNAQAQTPATETNPTGAPATEPPEESAPADTGS